MDDYRLIADRLATDIARGRLRPGDRLPPQRRFARELGIAGSTAARVYGELVRRGLAVGEVGRGTFIRAAEPATEPVLVEPAAAPVDLELNFPMLPEQADMLASTLNGLLRPDVLNAAMGAIGPLGSRGAREVAARALTRGGWSPEPEGIVFAGNGRQAIAACFSAVAGIGSRIAVEALTYPVAKAVATRLGSTFVPIETDRDGMRPESLLAAHRSGALTAVYLQTVLHNPLGFTMPPSRRAAIVEVVRELDLLVIEDGIYGFLREDLPPLAALAPERVIVIDSLSKRLAPGLSLGFAVTPPRFTDRVASAVRSGGWGALGFAMEAAHRLMADGTLARMEQAKREDARARQAMLADRFAAFTVRTDPRAYHCWWELPGQWRAETFVAAAARRGIAVTPAAAFTVGNGHAPNAVRLALGTPPREALSGALDVLAGLAEATPEGTGIE